SGGAFGYFPSYSLGAMMATQLFNQAKARTPPHSSRGYGYEDREEMPSLEADIRKGEFALLKKWLNAKVHDKGSMPGSADALLGSMPGSADALLESVTNKPLDPSIFVKYLEDKYSDLYKL
ncbi:hypothetical protein T484DRAFT_1820208, partial [Baffinella frigidus]